MQLYWVPVSFQARRQNASRAAQAKTPAQAFPQEPREILENPVAHLVLAATLVIWSFSFLAAARLSQDVGVAGSLAARFVPVLLGTGLYLLVKRSFGVPRGAWLKIVMMGILSVPLYNIFFFHGLKTVPTGTAALIIALNPVFTALLARIFLGEPFGTRRLSGLLLALLGVFVVIRYGTGKPVDWPYLTSAFLLALAPLSWAIYSVIGRTLPRGTDPFQMTYVLLFVGSLPMLALTRPNSLSAVASHPRTLAAALYLAIPCTLAGYAAWLWALKRLPAGETAAFVFLNPPLANLWAWLLEDAVLKPPFIAGAAVLLAGVGLIVWPLSLKIPSVDANRDRSRGDKDRGAGPRS